uniref:Late embryogenesis abundant protein LEA-2 subgroup domain-containing protein n=1 Tax=Aegilops tauschii TaxID=37682 RepID=R7W367_AEGTA
MTADASPDQRLPLKGAQTARTTGERMSCREVVQLVGLALLFCFLILLGGFLFAATLPTEPEYSVAITGAEGLDPARDLRSFDRRPTLSPVFNLTVHIELLDDSYYRACIGGHPAKLAVSYGGALLAEVEGPLLPELRVGPHEGRGANITARGVEVAVPRFERDRLAAELERGQAAFDVVVMAPRYDRQVLACKAMIGAGLRACDFQYYY